MQPVLRKGWGRQQSPRPARARRAVQLALMLALAISPMFTAFHAGARRGAAPSVATFRARDTGALDALLPTSPQAHWTQTVRRPVTDLLVRLRTTGGTSIDDLLSAVSADHASATATLFHAELILSAAGRIHVEDRAACGPWQADTAICRTECDGGAFALIRPRSATGDALRLVIGRIPAIRDAGFGETVRLGACSDTDAPGGLASRNGASSEVLLERR
ncbi:MAG: hypothetical protein R3D44_14870 [Hyphomicrobiaceae bacterium]